MFGVRPTLAWQREDSNLGPARTIIDMLDDPATVVAE
jgi:hypothetical protein